MRMSSGPSPWNEKPRSGSSSCIEETPMSSTTPSAGAKPGRLRRCGRARRSGLRPGSAGRRSASTSGPPRRWLPDRGRWPSTRAPAPREQRRGVAAGAERAVNEAFVRLAGPAPPAPREAARERGAASLCGAPSAGRGAAARRHSRAPPSPPSPLEAAPRAEQFAVVSDLLARAGAAGLEARGLPQLEFLPEPHEGDVGR